MPSPLFADSFSTPIMGLIRFASAINRPTSNSRCGNRSHLVTTIIAAAANIPEYFERLVFTFGHRDNDDLVCLAQIKTGRTRLPTSSMNRMPLSGTPRA